MSQSRWINIEKGPDGIVLSHAGQIASANAARHLDLVALKSELFSHALPDCRNIILVDVCISC